LHGTAEHRRLRPFARTATSDVLNNAAMAKKKRAPRRKKAAPQSVGLGIGDVSRAAAADLQELTDAVDRDGGAVLGSYRDPFGGTSVLMAALPIDLGRRRSRRRCGARQLP
jgi:hypothetical protein